MSAVVSEAAPPRRTTLPALATLGIGLLALVAIFWPEARAAVRVWTESTAFGHCFLVAPIAAFLAWENRDAVRGMTPRPAFAPALLGLPLAAAWFAAERLGIMEGRQLVALSFVELLFLVVLGWRLFFALSGPLLYLYFAVPFGAFVTPALQSFTAWFIDAGLTLLGIPHFITDMVIEVTSGTFFVAEACAGLRFLIASVAFGVFFALLNYRSPGRRAAFIAVSIIVPIVANGFRALGIVVLGQVLGSAQAAAADHLIYGWVFFSFVMLLLVVAGLPFREPPAGPPPARLTPPPPPRGALLFPAAVLILACLGPAAVLGIERHAPAAVLARRPPPASPAGCRLDPAAADAAQARYTMACDDRVWTVTVQATSSRSTGAQLNEARQAILGAFDADEAQTAPVAGAPGWQSVVVAKPFLLAGVSTWIDGQPATGGLAQRVRLARNSLSGSSPGPMVMALVLRRDRPMTDAQVSGALNDIARFAAAQ